MAVSIAHPAAPAGRTRLAGRTAQLSGEGALDVFTRARAREALGTPVAHLELGEPDFPTPAHVTDAALRALRDGDTRSGNPTRDHLASALAELEGGAGAVVTSTGMSAVALVAQLLRPGDLLVAPHDCYGGTYRLLNALARKGHFDVAFVDQTCPATLAAALARRPRLLWVETPSNPLLRITDLRHAASAGHAAGALVVADNTFLSPALQQPLALGADVVVHSTTKYLNGHSDVVGGAVVAADAALHEELAWWANCLGVTGAPFDSYLTLRGVRTLFARMRAHVENASAVVAALDGHPAVRRVHYPGLPDHPGHELARAQQGGFGAMVSVELHGGTDAVRAFLSGLRDFTLAESLGGVESLVAHPATMTHASMDAAARAAAGISDALLRLSVGIEDANDLVADALAGLDRAARETGGGCAAGSALAGAGGA
ncbi:MAG TPA: cystathionine gamma-synthase [Gemmatimonadaceae bacterium]|nr:cystathionine gamma-synthase [Gemmatimonadaceae bacterium]